MSKYNRQEGSEDVTAPTTPVRVVWGIHFPFHTVNIESRRLLLKSVSNTCDWHSPKIVSL